jgi:hypothetical protein
VTIEVVHLSTFEAEEYRLFVENCQASLIYHTPNYLRLLQTILQDAEPILLLAKREERIIGSFSAFMKESTAGTVLNSLPYYGSHGDILIADDEVDHAAVASFIADRLRDLCKGRSIGAVNIVTHPIASPTELIADRLHLTPWDWRIGQISELPAASSHEQAMASILAACGQKTRNLVRKGLRQTFEIEPSTADDDWHQLAEHHRNGMERIGGTAKSDREFAAIRSILEPQGLSRLYVARRRGAFAGALLNLHHGKWIEYFTPVASQDFRNEQVLSALIATAMCDAAVAGRSRWNWGGTWSSQAGVYHFKRGWGAKDHIYRYFGTVRDERLIKAAPRDLAASFPFFYVRPYAK